MNNPAKKIESQVKDKRLIETRRIEIVRAAVDLFVRKGFHKTTVREIAHEFGMSVGTLYEYIRTKEDILFLVCDYIHASVRDRVNPSLERATSSSESLKKAIDAYVRIIDEMQDYIVFLYQETKSLSHEDRKYIFGAEETMTAIFEEILKNGVGAGEFDIPRKDIHLIAHNIMVMGQMWAFRRWAIRKKYSLKKYIDLQTGFILSDIT